MSESTAIALVFVCYFAGMLAIGAWALRRTETLADYLLGGRRLGPWVTALSAGASDMSGWLLLGLPGYAYLAGVEAGWIALGLWLGTYLNWRVVADPLRRFTEQAGDSLTLSEFFERRFEDRSRVLRVVMALFTLIFFLFYTSSGLVAGGKLFETVFGVPYVWAVVLGAGGIVAYTFMGGFLAVCWTDLIQGLLMAAALVVVPAATLDAIGGWDVLQSQLDARNVHLLDAFTGRGGEPLRFIALASLLGWGLGYFGQPHILARFMAIESPAELPRARRIAMGWVTLGLGGALATGIVGVAAIEPALGDADSEKVFMILIDQLFHPIPAGILLSAILAAIMSTADSQLLVSSSVLVEDFYRPFVRPRASRFEQVLAGRLGVLSIALGATALALDPDSKVLDLVAYAWGGFGAAFGPAILLALYWKRMTRNGALAGIVTGGLTVIVWKPLSGGVFDLYELVPGFVFATLAIVVVSLLDKPPADWHKARSF